MRQSRNFWRVNLEILYTLKSVIKALCLIDIAIETILVLLFVLLAIFIPDTLVVFPVLMAYFSPGLIFSAIVISQMRTRKPVIAVSVFLIVFGNVFGIAAGILAILLPENESISVSADPYTDMY